MGENQGTSRNQIIGSLFWKFLERGGGQLVQFAIQLVLARLLLPSDYGSIALITIFITISNVFVEGGFNTALLQKSKSDELDFSSVFVLSFFISIIVYIVMFLGAPLISYMYEMGELTLIIRVLSITLIIGSVNSIQTTYYAKYFLFKKMFYYTLLSNLLSGVIGIYLAYIGYGVWSLVFQQLAQKIILTLIFLLNKSWIPNFNFSYNRIRHLFKFGFKLLLSNLINTVYNNLYGLIIGKYYSSANLGYYNRADQFPNIIVSNLNGAIQTVMLPAMASRQNNLSQVKSMVRKSIQCSTFIIAPLMLGMAACAHDIVYIILSDKWLGCVPILQLLCFVYIFHPIHTANLQAINAIGRSDIYLKIEIIKKGIGLTLLIVSIPLGLYAMIFFQIVNGFVSSFINAYPNKKLLGYGYKQQINDFFPNILISIIMCICLITMGRILTVPTLFRLPILVITGVFIYILLSLITKNKSFTYLLDIFKERLRKRG